jgi:hypothetical protein
MNKPDKYPVTSIRPLKYPKMQSGKKDRGRKKCGEEDDTEGGRAIRVLYCGLGSCPLLVVLN